MSALTPPRPLLVVGGDVSSYEAGEVWHLLDHRFDIAVTLIELERFERIDLDKYTHVIMVNGRYGSISDDRVADIKRWLRGGGVLIARTAR